MNDYNVNRMQPRRSAWILSDFRRYVIIGAGAALVDFTVYTLLARGLSIHPVMANSISRPLGGLVSFTGNRYWTFRGRGKAALHIQFVRFWIVWGLSFTLTEALIWLFHDGLHWEALISKLCAEGTAVLFNFLMQKYWTFH
ncbi:MAG: GtrA family protein [Verrucomicrobia bacterium]|nr:GtrA family protein [Verrucomicrobiota bacterium]MCG2681002.1 GtrA family protein [Kiritimatiellia bacterium]MBU4247782.1 GtrA family protein [Verrucomicrobiota bacterium]MBU4292070.1 GtrA family protein [Verrucomicrobiota bacterium]MBU4427857.1 GtrA family protein [Verrucomicrobiota bacterium]